MITNSLRTFAIILLLAAFGFAGCSHNADAPPREIAVYTIPRQPSTLYVPLWLNNAVLARKIDSSFHDPIVDTTKTAHVDIFNPALYELVPYTYVTKKSCETLGRVHTGGWFCKVNPACWVTVVIGHHVCDVFETGTKLVEKTKAARIIFDAPVHYKVRINYIQIEGNDSTLFVHINVGYGISVSVDGKYLKTGIVSCGFDKDGLAEVEFLLKASIGFDASGNIVLTNKDYGISWPKACNLTALNISPQDIINLPVVKQVVDHTLTDFVQNKTPKSVPIESLLKPVWPKVAKPVKLDTTGYLVVNATQLNTSHLYATKDSLLTVVGIACSPELILTKDTVIRPEAVMPKISNQKMDSGFNINLLATAPIKDLNNYLKPLVEKYGDSISFVRINEVKLFQSKDSLVVQVELTKPFRGTIYLWGTPKFDLAENTIGMDHLEYTASSKAILVQYANAILTNRFVERWVQKYFKYKYERKLTDAIKGYKNFNRRIASDVYLAGELYKVSPASVTVSDNSLNVVVNVSGQAHLELR